MEAKVSQSSAAAPGWQLEGNAPLAYDTHIVDVFLQDYSRVEVAAIKPGDRVLDAACGTGVVTRSIEHCPWQAAIADAVERNVGSEQAAQIRSAFSFGDADQLQQVIVAAGFRGVEIRIERETIRHASIAEYVPGYISAIPVAAAVAGLGKEAQAKITADVRDALAAYRVGDGLAAPIEAHVATGHR
jgi:hypothetical protein